MMSKPKNAFKMPRDLGEASLVNVARKAAIEGVWMFQEGVFRDISEQQAEGEATFRVRLTRRTPFIVYHIHPAKYDGRCGYFDVTHGFKISPPSLVDFRSHVNLRKTFGELMTSKVADGWGVWTYALTEEAERGGLLQRIDGKTLAGWIFAAYHKFKIYTLRPTLDQRRGFGSWMKDRGILLKYDTIHDLYARAAPV